MIFHTTTTDGVLCYIGTDNANVYIEDRVYSNPHYFRDNKSHLRSHRVDLTPKQFAALDFRGCVKVTEFYTARFVSLHIPVHGKMHNVFLTYLPDACVPPYMRSQPL
jgi:hypothetical protein